MQGEGRVSGMGEGEGREGRIEDWEERRHDET